MPKDDAQDGTKISDFLMILALNDKDHTTASNGP